MHPISVIFADDQPFYCEALSSLLREEDGIRIVAVARHGVELIQLVRQLRPDVVITDMQMPEMDGLEAMRAIKEEFPEVAVIGLTLHEDEYRARDLMEQGADGYLSKLTVTTRELLEAVRTVYSGRYYFSRHTSPKLSRIMASCHKRFFPPPSQTLLTEKEIEIVRLICQELTSKEIGPQVGLTQRSVEVYREKIMEKIGAQNSVGIAIYALQNGIYRP